jgi:hypothetical protein
MGALARGAAIGVVPPLAPPLAAACAVVLGGPRRWTRRSRRSRLLPARRSRSARPQAALRARIGRAPRSPRQLGTVVTRRRASGCSNVVRRAARPRAFAPLPGSSLSATRADLRALPRSTQRRRTRRSTASSCRRARSPMSPGRLRVLQQGSVHAYLLHVARAHRALTVTGAIDDVPRRRRWIRDSSCSRRSCSA